VALRDIDLEVKRGEFLFIAGPSGAGKSSLLKLLFGEERASRGELIVANQDVSLFDRAEISAYRRNIGVIFQDYRLIKTKTVCENVEFSLEVRGVSKKERKQAALRILSAVGLEERAEEMPQSLSGGEQQRIAISRALVSRPNLILADEPTGNLDPELTYSVFKLLLEANQCGATVIVASHNLNVIEELNRRTIVLDRGRIVGDFLKPKG